MNKKRTFGIINHSPLDLQVLLPTNAHIVLSPTKSNKDILLTPRYEETHNGYQFVFGTFAELSKLGMRIIDGSDGRFQNLTNKYIDYMLGVK